jgi:hypothetical protein
MTNTTIIDPISKSDVYVRPRAHSVEIAMPIFGQTIGDVVATAERLRACVADLAQRCALPDMPVSVAQWIQAFPHGPIEIYMLVHVDYDTAARRALDLVVASLKKPRKRIPKTFIAPTGARVTRIDLPPVGAPTKGSKP